MNNKVQVGEEFLGEPICGFKKPRKVFFQKVVNLLRVTMMVVNVWDGEGTQERKNFEEDLLILQSFKKQH